MMPPALEKSLVPELGILDCAEDLLWHRDGRVTLGYRLAGLHEPALGDEELNAAAFAFENVLSGLPEETSYQFYVLMDHHGGLSLVDRAFPPIAPGEADLLEELRCARCRELKRVDENFV